MGIFTFYKALFSKLLINLLLMCFSAYLSNKCSYIFSATFLFILLYIGYMHKLNDWLII